MKQTAGIRFKNYQAKNKNNNQKLADMMMDNIVNLGRFSYELEEKREQSLINQSSQMLVAFSVFSAALYMILPVIIDNTTISIDKLLFSTGIVAVFLIISLVLAVLAQWRFKYNTIVDIEVLFNKINEEYQNYKTQAQFDMQWKEQLVQIQTSKKKNNDKRAKLIIASMVVFLISIALVLISAFLLILITL